MNTELKAILGELLDLEHVAVDAAGKKNLATVIVPDLITAGMAIPGVVSSWSDLKAEIAALSTPANQQDLETYILSLVSGTTAKAQAIIAAVVNTVLALDGLYNAIKM